MSPRKLLSGPEAPAGTSVLPRAVARRQGPFWRRPWVLIALAVAAAAFLALSVVLADRDTLVAEQQTDATQEALGTVSDPLAELCRTDPAIRVRVGDAACGLAQRAADNPEIPTPGPAGADGEPGEAGAEGRGIVSTSLVDDALVINYSDGSRENVGRVVGTDGATGSQGPAGVGITGSNIAAGRLILTFSDGTTRDVGQVVGPAGEPGAAGVDGDAGADGSDGRGIASVDQVDGRLTVAYTDGETQDIGPVPTGPAGPAGPAGADGSPATTLVLQGAGPLGADLTCERTNDDPMAPIYTCS